jgi:hypothetical protein
MWNIVLIGIALFIVVFVVLALLKIAIKIALVVGLIALVVFGGIYLAYGKEGLDESLETTGHAIEEVRDSDAYQGAKDTAGDYGQKAVNWTKEQIVDTIE